MTQLGAGAPVLKPDGSADFRTAGVRRIVEWVVAQVHGHDLPVLPLDVALQEQEKQHDLSGARRAVFLPTSSDRDALDQHVSEEARPMGDAASPPSPGSSRGGFFTVDRRAWAHVCGLGMHAAVAYLAIARGTDGDNRTCEWSTNAIQRRTGISRSRAAG